jgi:hypothetical protein
MDAWWYGLLLRRLPIFLPLAISLFDVLANVVVLSQEAHSASLPRHSGLILLPGSVLLSGGSALAFNVGLAGMIEWLSRTDAGKRKGHNVYLASLVQRS